jgi:hypothetical protein
VSSAGVYLALLEVEAGLSLCAVGVGAASCSRRGTLQEPELARGVQVRADAGCHSPLHGCLEGAVVAHSDRGEPGDKRMG